MKLPANLPKKVGLCMCLEDMPEPAFDDDLVKACCLCERAVRVRPHMPAIALICNRCAGIPAESVRDGRH